MAKDIIVDNNFYRDPYSIREYALNQEFKVIGNYPGVRTEPYLRDIAKMKIEILVGSPITRWFEDYCGSFQRVSENESTWIHSDKYNGWAAVCYLHPDPPAGSGTAFYSFDGRDRTLPNVEDPNPHLDGWVQTDYIENKWNRIVLYRGDLYHKATGYFGDIEKPETQRLFQVFFFNT